jgi:hypothetical protein
MSDFAQKTRRLGGAAVASWMPHPIYRVIQRGTVTITNTNTSGTDTLALAVDTKNARLRFLGLTTNDGSNSTATVTLTNSTTVTATRKGNTNSTVVSYEVTEYNPGIIKQIQRGVITVAAGGATGTYTISPAVLSVTNTELDYLGSQTLDSGAPTNQDNNGRLTLTNTTTVTATHGNTFDWVMGVQVVEFY